MAYMPRWYNEHTTTFKQKATAATRFSILFLQAAKGTTCCLLEELLAGIAKALVSKCMYIQHFFLHWPVRGNAFGTLAPLFKGTDRITAKLFIYGRKIEVFGFFTFIPDVTPDFLQVSLSLKASGKPTFS